MSEQAWRCDAWEREAGSKRVYLSDSDCGCPSPPPALPRGARGEHRIHMRLVCWLGVVVFGLLPLMASAQENPFASQYATALKNAGISSTKEDIAMFLKQNHPKVGDGDALAKLIKSLGDDDFFVRESAMLQLLRMPQRDNSPLEAALKSDDPEVRWRIKVVLEQTNKPKQDLLYAALVVIHNQKMTGLTDEILGCAPVCLSDHLKQALNRALEVTATPEDAAKLRKLLESKDVTTRSAAIVTLSKVLRADAAPDLKKLLMDDVPSVRLLAAEQLLKVDARNADALLVLADLLDSDVTSIRVRSSQLLRTTINTELPYSAFATADVRKAQAEALRAFVKDLVAKMK